MVGLIACNTCTVHYSDYTRTCCDTSVYPNVQLRAYVLQIILVNYIRATFNILVDDRIKSCKSRLKSNCSDSRSLLSRSISLFKFSNIFLRILLQKFGLETAYFVLYNIWQQSGSTLWLQLLQSCCLFVVHFHAETKPKNIEHKWARQKLPKRRNVPGKNAT